MPGGSYGSALGWTGAGADRNLVRRLVGVANLDGADITPTVETLDVAAFAVAVVIGVGCYGGADQDAGGNAPAEAAVRMSLSLAANGGEGSSPRLSEHH